MLAQSKPQFLFCFTEQIVITVRMAGKSSVLTINIECVRLRTTQIKGKTQKATLVAAAMDLTLQVRQKDRTQVYPLVIIMV